MLGPTEVSDPIDFLASDPDGDRLSTRCSRRQHGRASARHGDHRSSDRNIHLRPRRRLHRSRRVHRRGRRPHQRLHFHGLSQSAVRSPHTDTATISLNIVAANPNDAPAAVNDTAYTHRRRHPARHRRPRSAGQRHRPRRRHADRGPGHRPHPRRPDPQPHRRPSSTPRRQLRRHRHLHLHRHRRRRSPAPPRPSPSPSPASTTTPRPRSTTPTTHRGRRADRPRASACWATTPTPTPATP